MSETRVEPALPVGWLFVFVLAVVFPPLFLIVPIRAPGVFVLVGLAAFFRAMGRRTIFLPAFAVRGPPLAG